MESLSFNIFNSNLFSHIKKTLVQNEVSYNTLKKKLSIVDASNWMPKTRNILMIKGKYDQFVLYNNSLENKWNLKDNQIRFVKCGHSGLLLSKKIVYTDTIELLKRGV